MEYRYSPDAKIETVARILDATVRGLAVMAIAVALIIILGQWAAL